jgi:catechol 2,3-dioxygenase-like lactoylglutathione lyase family enzyme
LTLLRFADLIGEFLDRPEVGGGRARNQTMTQSIVQVALIAGDYDEAVEFYVDTLGFTLIEEMYSPEQDKHSVVVAPLGAIESRLLLARAAGGEQSSRIGNQTGGLVFLFLHTDDFWHDDHAYNAKGVIFV